ncbi:MAG: hypothetical protein IPG53_18780 [Ignavibacteriales bacterium]|nr:hypothetical protein [Ignavibacteriales bacterium]
MKVFIFFLQGKRLRLAANLAGHYENLKAIDEFELALDDKREAKLQDVARCGAFIFRLKSGDTAYNKSKF